LAGDTSPASAVAFAQEHPQCDTRALEAQARDEQERIRKNFISKANGKERIAHLRAEMTATMESGAGIYRTESSLKDTCNKLAELKDRFPRITLDDHSLTFNTELTAALERSPTNLFLLLSRGNLAARAGDRKAALADYERAVHLKSDNVPALYQYGLALLEDGQVPEATATFDRLVRVSAASPQGYYGRARVFAANGDGAHAAEALSEAARRVEPDARERLAEQGLKGEALDRAVREATDRSLAQMRQDPAFARWSQDPGFRGTAWR